MDIMAEKDPLFEQRKRDHLRIALDPRAQSSRTQGFEDVDLVHEALPDLDFSDVDLGVVFNGYSLNSPLFISSMTAGHEKGREINAALARLSDRRRLLMGVGSQRRELEDASAAAEWTEVRRQAPHACLVGNLGIAQVIRLGDDGLRALVDGLEAAALFIHLNPLQECLQPEGTPRFRGGLRAIERAVKAVGVPVIVKETGCGFSTATLRHLAGTGVFAVDVSGLGGTHWGRVEGQRLPPEDPRAEAALAFADWGISTVQSLINAADADGPFQVWASGGIRNGVEAAKAIAMGSHMVGLARPWLEAVLASDPDAALDRLADRLEFELKTSLFCTGSRSPDALRAARRWTWRT